MKIGNLDSSKKVIIVAEIGNNHEGCFQLAKKLVDKAAETGVDAVKFQTFQTKTFVAPSQADRYQRMLGFELAQEQFAELAERAQSNGLKFISSPLDLPSAAFLSHIADAIKIASGDNTFYPLIKFVAGTKKPVIISTGFSDQAKIDATVSLFRMTRKSSKPTNDFALLHCVSAYPVEIADANLGAIAALSRKYGCNSTIGYSDHTLGITAATLAVAGGARIIEKHFTIDRHHSHFRDHQLSADPKMMKELVKNIRESETYLGSGIIGPRQIEIDTELPVRRSIAASNNLVEGHKVTKDDIMWIRPGHGYAPGQEKKVVGKKLKTSIQMGELFSKEHFQE